MLKPLLKNSEAVIAISVMLGLIIGNFLWQLTEKNMNYIVAFERSFFQFFALVAYFITIGIHKLIKFKKPITISHFKK